MRAMLCVNAACAVVRCMSVRLSVTFVYSVFKNSFTVGQPHHSSFSIQNVMAIFRQGQNRNFRPISGFGIDDWLSVISSFDRAVKFIAEHADDDRHASVNLVYDSKRRRRFQHSTSKPKTTEHNLIIVLIINLEPK